ncbi:MAG: tRNA glutamyl-Q(34) synthetase GluQRS [Geminicoccaceae bacterium]|nr:MAG: tRNA glutamyl-Q(34) synthetase GluQRS [Geminicoccaceae bacterium]
MTAGEVREIALRGPDFVPVLDGAAHVTRFAPSPTGYLHLGHAYAARFAHDAARLTGGRFLLRLEDLDPQRCRPEFATAILEDLQWLGLRFDGVVVRQSERMALYRQALERLRTLGVLYPCFCTRKQVREEIADAAAAPHGPSGERLYPGTCRALDPAERARRIGRGEAFAWRLDVARALERTGPLAWYDVRAGWVEADPAALGDVVLARKDVPASYHLAVVVDDAAQGVTLVTRGEDLFHATHVHRLLQALLGLPVPRWYHHNLVGDRDGRRMAKRTGALTLRHLRARGLGPAEIWRMLETAAATTPACATSPGS